MNERREYFKFIVSMLIFGFNGVLVANIDLTSPQVVLTRTFFGSIVLAVAVIISKDFSVKQLKADMWPLLIAGACLGLNWMLLFESYRYASVSIGTLVYYCGPMLVMALSPVLFREKLTWNKLTALAAVAAGMVCITGLAGESQDAMRGILCGAGAACLYATLIVSNKHIKHVSGVLSTLAELVIGFVVILIYLLFRGEFPFSLPGGTGLISVLVLGFVSTGLACWMYFSSMQKLPGQTVALCCYIDPLSAVIFAAIFLHETLTPLQLVGAVLILGGALFGEIRFRKKAALPEK